MQRVHAAPHPDMGPDSSEHLGAEVRVTLEDGWVLAKRVGAALGRGPDNPLPADALAGKFANCAGRALPGAQVERLQQILSRLEQEDSLRAVVAAISVDAPERLARRA
jgi:2-methylcitrate dehydratase PrpD